MPKSINVRSQTLRKYCAQNRIEIGDCLEVDSMAATLDLVARSDWVAIVPALIVADSAEHMGLHAMRLPDPGLMLDLVIAEPARSPVKAAGRAFQASLKSYTNKINERWLS